MEKALLSSDSNEYWFVIEVEVMIMEELVRRDKMMWMMTSMREEFLTMMIEA